MLTVKQVAERLRISASLVYSWCEDHLLPHYRMGGKGKRGKILIERFEGCQQLQQRLRWGRFDDQLFTLFAHDRMISGEFELAGNSRRLVGAVLKEFHATFRDHARPCLSIGQLEPQQSIRQIARLPNIEANCLLDVFLSTELRNVFFPRLFGDCGGDRN